MDILSWADYILSECDNNASQFRLHRVIYSLKVWGLVAGIPLVDGAFHRWKYGPVSHELHDKRVSSPHKPLSPDKKQLADFIIENYLPLPTVDLILMNDHESAWKQPEPLGEITAKMMIDFYQQHHFAKNFYPEFDQSRPFYRLQTNSWNCFTMDMNDEDREFHGVFPSYNYYKKLKQQVNLEL